MVMITCPTTGQSIATGVETDSDSFERIPDVLSHTRCPLCGLDHTWWKHEARLADQLERPPPQLSDHPNPDRTAL
jgi:hypothetical protein